MNKTWILIADAHRARCFERNAADQSLTELADFVLPHTSLQQAAGGGDLTGAAGKGHGRSGHAGTQFEPHTEAQDKDRVSFAHQLADYLNHAVAEQTCHGLVLLATAPMLGDLRPLLNTRAKALTQRSVAIDLTHYVGPELKARVTHALALPPGK